jgi:hypothetical protein
VADRLSNHAPLPGAAMCGAKEIRTPDLFDANEALYQLSYSPGWIRSWRSGTGDPRLQIFPA